jgi:two-component system cell cycle response regulator
MTATVLVVDDLDANIKLLEVKLLKEYYTVVSATSGLQALKELENNKIDIVLLDVMMPEMDGFETCRKIKSNPDTAHIPVVMVTALSDVEDRVKGLESGADEFLTKPVNDVALFARVRSLTRMKTIVEELKLRNQTVLELGGQRLELKANFTDSKIVLLDDDVIQAKNIKSSLQSLTDQVIIFSSPEDIDTLGTFVPDMIIISCQIEDVDPLRIVTSMRSKAVLKNTVFMFLAEEENMPVVIRGMELGVNDYFIYPVDTSELQARVKTQLRRKHYQDSLRLELEKKVDLSTKDSLTSLFNRRYFDIHIKQMVDRVKASNKVMSVLMLDVDHFKEVNDTYGHQAGDAVLKMLSGVLQDQFRVTDLIARYGGEEFVVLLGNIGGEEALKIAERIREVVENKGFVVPGREEVLEQTVSIGVAELASDDDVEKLIARADRALYKAKNSGRNRVVSL